MWNPGTPGAEAGVGGEWGEHLPPRHFSFLLSQVTFSHHLGQAMTHTPGHRAGPALPLLRRPDLRSWR